MKKSHKILLIIGIVILSICIIGTAVHTGLLATGLLH